MKTVVKTPARINAEPDTPDTWPEGSTWVVHESGALTIQLGDQDLGGYGPGFWCWVWYQSEVPS